MTTASPAPRAPRAHAHRTAVLGQNQYGKAENRVVKIVRDGPTHSIKDLNVSVSLTGDLDEVHYSGSNANVLPTDTTKNTVFAFAKQHGIASAEHFGTLLARHFVESCEPLRTARIRIEEYAWERIESPRTGHSFVRTGQETRTAQVTFDGERFQVLSGLRGLTVLNSTDSEFWGYLKDAYTTLPEDHDRILATEVAAVWRHDWDGVGAPKASKAPRAGEAGEAAEQPAWDASYAQVKGDMLGAFAETYSLSLQQTLYEMGARVLADSPGIAEIRFAMPNKHHFRVDLAPFGLTNDAADGAVYLAADRPYGLIEATVLRDGAEALIPVDMTGV